MAHQLEHLLRDFFAGEDFDRITGSTPDCLSLAVIGDVSAKGLNAAESKHAAQCRRCLHALTLAFRQECPSEPLLAAYSAGQLPIAEAVRNHIEQDQCEACRSATERARVPNRWLPEFGYRSVPALSAAAILIVALGYVLWSVSRERRPSPPLGEPAVASLMDGTGQVVLTRSGKIVLPGRNALPTGLAASVKDLFTKTVVQQPDNLQLALAATRTDRLERGASGEMADDPVLLSPVATAVRSTRPTFSWRPVESAASYTLYVADRNKKLVWKGSAGQQTSLTLPSFAPELVRGEMYLWQVEATLQDEPKLSRWDSFVVLDEAGLASVIAGEKRYPYSALLLGALYEAHGLYDEAKKQFGRLAELNPTSALPGEMLASLKQLRQRP